MKFILVLLTILSTIPSFAAGVETAKDGDDEIKKTYEGNIRGVRALMADLQNEQPLIYQKLKNDFTSLDTRQSRADTIAYVAYGVSIGFTAYGISQWLGVFKKSDDSEGSGASLTPFLISLGTSLVGGWAYYIARPSPQEYLDFTNKHNKLNKSSQLQWDLSMDLRKNGAKAAVTYYF